MKSRLWCICVIMMLAVSPAAFAEIVIDGDWIVSPWVQAWGAGVTSTTETSSASADVSGFYAYAGAAGANPWSSAHTTIRAICEWRYWVYAYSEARLYLSTEFQPCLAFAFTDVYASSSSSYPPFDPQHYQFVCFVDETMFDDQDPHYEIVMTDGDESYDQDQAWFDPDEGVYGEHNVQACAEVELMGYEEAYAHACARAKVSLRQTYP